MARDSEAPIAQRVALELARRRARPAPGRRYRYQAGHRSSGTASTRGSRRRERSSHGRAAGPRRARRRSARRGRRTDARTLPPSHSSSSTIESGSKPRSSVRTRPIPQAAPRKVQSTRSWAAFRRRRALIQGRNHSPHGHSGKAELGKQPLQPQARPVKSRVMPRPAQPGDREPGLLWIEFPRVDVERAWHTATFAILQRLLNQHVRQHPEVGGSLRNDAASRAGPRPSGLLAAPTSAGRRGQLDTRSPADGSEIGSSHSGTLPRSTRLVPTPARVRLRSWARGSRPLGHPPGLRAAASYAEWNDGILPASAASPDGAPSHAKPPHVLRRRWPSQLRGAVRQPIRERKRSRPLSAGRAGRAAGPPRAQRGYRGRPIAPGAGRARMRKPGNTPRHQP